MNLTQQKAAVLATPAVMLGLFSTSVQAAPFCVDEAKIVDIQSALRYRQLTATDLVQTYLSRINAYDQNNS